MSSPSRRASRSTSPTGWWWPAGIRLWESTPGAALNSPFSDKGGKLLGYPIKLSGQDEGCNAEGGQAAATKLASDPTIVAAIGSNCSSASRPGAPILWKAGIPTVSPSNTAPYLTDPKRGKEYDGYLRTAHNDKIQGAVAAEFAYKKLGVKKAATVHDGSVYAEQLQAVFAESFKKLGGTITAQEAVAPTDTDMRPVLTKIATGQPEFIYFPIFIAAGGHLARQAKEVAGLEKTALMSADGTFSPDFYKAAGDAAVGMYHSSPDFSAFGAGYKDFLAKHQKKYGEKPIAPFHAHGYDAAMMIFNAIEKTAVKDGDTLYVCPHQAAGCVVCHQGPEGPDRHRHLRPIRRLRRPAHRGLPADG